MFLLIAFKCEYCDRKYAYKGDLTKHLRTHLGDNIYKCAVCDEGFQWKKDLNRHSNEHYKQERDNLGATFVPNINQTQ